MQAKRESAESAAPAPAPLGRLFLVAALVAFFGVGMSAFLNYFKFKSALESAARSRMAVPALAVREGVQASLALGLPLASAAAVPDLLARERQADAAIRAIEVFDAEGRVVFSAGAAAPGSAIPAAWLVAARASAGDAWHVLEPDSAVLGFSLRNSFDLPQGHVAVRYALTDQQQALARMRAALQRIALIGGAATALLAMLAVWAVLRFSGRAQSPAAR
ncbi:hypothetical protein OPU71_05100 [Niveibacterium sp. 24ML]|uniref:hypothetical protein n=1 Tax=Niveibacterium sp. 24ML TaxID=2985512 RepID=UPI0022701B33|nr:hypothetical protein [Niveibacterium sp. 24ML]MCX9155498.1 hypothetical protein [Niveibacterium sp. 24ML]